ncbi:MAG: hypothetical protein OQK12_04480 [Motiliproteus sp.]|nr:hypothetical protein [Motiliproteus sp.]MCW9052573.1 hypothetical protein [Motiliproteus sp.]
MSKNSSIYQNVTRTLEKQLQTQQLQFDTYYLPNAPETAHLDQYDLLISVGTLATQKAMELDQLPILSTFIPRRTYQTLIKRNTGLEERQQQGQVSALYLEQPFHRQLQLLSLIKPNVEKLATILGPTSKQELSQLEQAASQMQWQLNLKQLGKDDNPVELLSPLIEGSDAFLAVPDKSIFNRSTAKWILLMTFRQRIPLIAYSKRYVDAGAVAGVFSTPKTVGQETAGLVKQWLKTGRLSSPAHPKQFDIGINRATARSLRLKLPPLDMLKKQLEEQ